MAGHIPWETVDLTLRASRTIWLATASADGQPHAVPVWFLWDGESAWFVVRGDTRNGRNLAVRPDIVLHLGDGDEVVLCPGRAEVVNDPETVGWVDGLYGAKYVDPGSGARATVQGDDHVLYRLVPQRVIVWSYGKIGNRTDFPAPVGSSRLSHRRGS